MNKFYSFFIVYLIGIPIVKAQTTDSTAFARTLDEVTVTSSRMALSARKLPQKIEVLTSRDLELTPSNDLADLMKKLSSVNIVQYAHGYSYINLRGFAPNTFHGSNSIQPETSILINGRPAGTVNIAVLDKSSVERIEILKGPSAARYGANTMGGVVNIITKKSSGKIGGNINAGYGTWNTFDANAHVGGTIVGGLDFDVSGSFFDRGKDFQIGQNNLFRNNFGWRNSTVIALDGEKLSTPDDLYDGLTREFTRMQNYSAMFRVGYQFNQKWRLDVINQRFETTRLFTLGDMRTINRENGYRGYNSTEASLIGTLGGHKLLAKAYLSNEKVKTFPFFNAITQQEFEPYQSYESNVDYKGILLQDDYKLSNSIRLAFGADYYEAGTALRNWNAPTPATSNLPQERAATSPNGIIKDLGVFAQAHLSIFKDYLILNPSFRTDFVNYSLVSTFGLEERTQLKNEGRTVHSPNLGLQINLTQSISIQGNIGRAFRYAVANQVAGFFETFTTTNPPRINVTLGNPDLNNETSFTWETGVRFGNVKKGFYIDATYFNTNVNDRIITVSDAARVNTDWQALDGRTYRVASFRTFANANYSKFAGLELDGYYDLGALNQFKRSFKLFFNAIRMFGYDDFVKSSSPSTPDTRSKARQVADLSIGGGIEYDDMKRFSVRLSGRYVGVREYVNFNDVVNPQKFRNQRVIYPPHLTLDVVASYIFLKNHTLSLRIQNLTDENFYELRYQPMPGRNSSIRYAFRF